MTPSDFHPPLSDSAWGLLPTRPAAPYALPVARLTAGSQPWLRWYKPTPPARDWTPYRTLAIAVLCVLSPVVLHAALMLLSSLFAR